jgi:protein-S-isoprenylcysteine O-methyltransferase Ste14
MAAIQNVFDLLSLIIITAYIMAPIYFSLLWRLRGFFRVHGKIAFFLYMAIVAVVSFAIAYATSDFWFSQKISLPSLSVIFGMILLLFSLVVMTIAQQEMGGIPARIGMPHFSKDKKPKLVTTGLFGRVRHPMYMTAFLMGIAMFLATGYTLVLIASVVWLVVMRFYTDVEEKVLIEEFGKQYEEYRKRVPRFVPRLF